MRFLFRDFHGSCDGGVAWVEGVWVFDCISASNLSIKYMIIKTL